MTKQRFKDEGTYLFQFMEVISVVCPKCQSHALVVCKGYPGRNQQPARVVCENCGYNKEHSDTTWKGKAHDPFFGLPLWFVGTVRDHELWAYNREHLAFIKRVVSAELREQTPNQNSALSNRLPKWMLDRKNRAAVLKVVERLEKR